MPYQLRFWHLCALLLFALVLAMPAYWHAPQAIAQTQAAPASAATAPPPTPTSVATPAPTPTDDELIGVAPATGWMRQLWARFGWWALPLALVALAILLVSGAVSGAFSGIKKAFENAAEQLVTPQLKRFGSTYSRAVDAYFDRQLELYQQLPLIGVATEQVKLDVDQVYIPLRLAERAEVEQHQRRMRGEDTEESKQPSRVNRLFGDLPSRRDRRVFKPLSDPEVLARRRRSYERRQRFERWLPRFLRRRSAVQLSLFESDSSELPPELIAPPEPTQALLLLGGAGSGKTMTLRYALLCCIAAYRQHNATSLGDDLGLYLPRPPFPIYVRLTLFAQQLPTDDERLPGDYAGADPELFLSWLDRSNKLTLSEQVKRGGCLLLLDGLDEAGSEARRAYIASLIDKLAGQYRNNRYIVASRTTGYGGRVQLGNFNRVDLAALEPPDSQQLLGRWFRAVYARHAASHQRVSDDDQAQQQSARLWDVISRNTRLLEMASNPLLATTMALLQYNHVDLPDQRAKLYEKLIELLIDLWRKTMVANDTMSTTMGRSTVQRATLLRRVVHLALRMQLQPTQAREVTLHQAQEWLAPLLRDTQGHPLPREDADPAIEEMLESLSVESGLVQRSSRTDQVYSFAHYTLQEYLAACGLDILDTHQHPNASIAFLLHRCDDARWHETLLLAAGEWSNRRTTEKVTELLRGLLSKRSSTSDLLAAEALADIGQMDELAVLRNDIAPRLRALAFDPAACPDARMRNRAATLLDRLGADTRPELNPANAAYWAAPIAPGPFQMGPAPVWWNSNDQPESAFTAHIQRPYRLARFPVTNALYQQFLDALVANDTGPAAQEAYEQHRPGTWPGRSYRPGEGQHPVTGVSWHDAMAFAAWLDAQLRAAGVLAAGEQVRLPLETEWERAAAYPAAPPAANPAQGRRAYPWGAWPAAPALDNAALLSNLLQQADAAAVSAVPGPANTKELGIGATSAVGIFPQGAAGCKAEDMAGNVWEWCASAASPYPLPADLAPETLDTQAIISLRGGSWYTDQTGVLGGARYDYIPHRHFDDSGLRVARAFSR